MWWNRSWLALTRRTEHTSLWLDQLKRCWQTDKRWTLWAVVLCVWCVYLTWCNSETYQHWYLLVLTITTTSDLFLNGVYFSTNLQTKSPQLYLVFDRFCPTLCRILVQGCIVKGALIFPWTVNKNTTISVTDEQTEI